MIQIIIKLLKFFLNPRLIPSQIDQMSQNLPYVTKKHVREYKPGINGRRASPLIFNYYVNKLEGLGVSVCADSAEKYKKHVDIILERFRPPTM